MRIFAVLLGQSSSIVPATGRFPLAAICPDMAITRLYFACPGANGRSLAIADRGIKGRGRRCSGRMECDVGEQLIGHVSRHRQWHGALRVSDDQHVTVTNWVRRRRAVPVHRSLDASCVTSDSISAEVVWGDEPAVVDRSLRTAPEDPRRALVRLSSPCRVRPCDGGHPTVRDHRVSDITDPKWFGGDCWFGGDATSKFTAKRAGGKGTAAKPKKLGLCQGPRSA